MHDDKITITIRAERKHGTGTLEAERVIEYTPGMMNENVRHGVAEVLTDINKAQAQLPPQE